MFSLKSAFPLPTRLFPTYEHHVSIDELWNVFSRYTESWVSAPGTQVIEPGSEAP